MKSKNQRYDSDLLRGNTDVLLLFLISELDMAYGYRLIKEIEKRSQGFFQFKEGTVYPALHKLENEGLVKAQWTSFSSGLERRYYTITEKGKAVLQNRLTMWQNFANAMDLVFKPAVG
jgi:PadR family transcriptional regulator PadR